MLREIEQRGSESGHGFRNIRVDNKTFQWRKFLSNSKNKLLLIPLRIVRKWDTQRLAGKKIFVTAEDRCYEVSSIGTTTRKLRSTQEEADTRVLLHAAFFLIKPRFDKRVSFRRTSLILTNESRLDSRTNESRIDSRTNESRIDSRTHESRIDFRTNESRIDSRTNESHWKSFIEWLINRDD